MSEGVAVTPGSGATIAADIIGGDYYQRVKVTFGADGGASDVSSSAPLPVEVLASDLPAGASSEDTQLQVLGVLNDLLTADTATIAELPHQPLDATSDMLPGNVSRTGAGETTMVAAVLGQTTRLHEYSVSVPGAGTVEIRNGASGTALRKHIFPLLGGLDKPFRERPRAITSANTALVFYWSGSGEANIDFDSVTSA